MAIRYRATTTIRLNTDGIWGAWMLIVSQLVQAISWYYYFAKPDYGWLGLIALTSVTVPCGFVLLLIGRDYDSIVDETN
ncbi:hypothetical protein NKI12_30380 [Mesorhizobium australicum]|uniref:Uncharacterized protein n=1 Tax=Mesorhizobium australicum TaxID=536018 RepID=A0ACC6T8F3_9HYPH